MMKSLLSVLLPVSILIGTNFVKISIATPSLFKKCDTFLESSEPSLTSNEGGTIQKLLLAGFNYNEDNRFNVLKGGFTSKRDAKQCIPVNYKIDWNCTSTEACYNNSQQMCFKSDDFFYLWTVFDATTIAGDILIRLAAYDLRVFGFELCDIYREPVEIKITILEEVYIPINCFSLCKGLVDFTMQVS